MEIRELLLPEFDSEMKKARTTLERVPETKLEYKPHEKSMAIGKLAAHIARLRYLVVPIVNLPELDFATAGIKPLVMESSEQLVKAFDDVVDQSRKALESADDAHLLQSWRLLVQGRIIIDGSRYQAIRFMVLNHLIHHRAQLGVYLRLNNIAVPSVYGPSADET